MRDELKQQIANLPDEPGVYKYFDQEGSLIYVGKAKSLKKRVSSYFTKTLPDGKTRRLVSQIYRLEVVVVQTEFDAYLLENNLIKNYHPKYNILLRDDKTYPYIIITSERFPRVFSTRRMEKGKGTYFGPYSGVKTMNTVLELIKKIYSLRTCTLALSEENIRKQKFKVCLEYHIGNCKGPCENLQTESHYLKEIEQIKHILGGDLGDAQDYLKDQIAFHAEKMEYEKAQKLKEKLELLDKFQSGSVVVSPRLGSFDVFTVSSEEDICYVNHLTIGFGRIINGKTIEIRRRLEEPDEEVLAFAIVDYCADGNTLQGEVLVNLSLELPYEGVVVTVPKIGEKKKLIDLSLRNTLFFKKDRLERLEEKEKDDRNKRVLETLQKELNLKELPVHIECFDNSNLQGTNAVAAMVCYKNGVPAKKDWRHFNIKTVEGPDDFASMREIVLRRYGRMIREEQPLPNLILIDGGKGQLSSAVESLNELGIYGKVAVVGIAKRLEEIYVPGDDLPLFISKKSEGLKLLQKVRDDTHRFGITFHRKKRSKQLNLDKKAKEINRAAKKK